MPLGVVEHVMAPSLESPYMQKPIDVIDTAFNLYGFLPGDDDERWNFLARYEEIKQRTEFSRMNLANAWGATYLSDVTSYRRGYICTINPENSLQLDRALDNLDAAEDLHERFRKTDDGEGDVRFSLTDRLTTDPTQPELEITPCPEALYQVRLFFGGYLARVGFNIHREENKGVLSLVNIQGAAGSVERLKDFHAQYGIRPFNMLVQRAVAIAAAGAEELTVRGLANPARGNSRLYWGVLDKEQVDMYHAQRRQPAEI